MRTCGNKKTRKTSAVQVTRIRFSQYLFTAPCKLENHQIGACVNYQSIQSQTQGPGHGRNILNFPYPFLVP